MSILKADILTFANAVLKRSETSIEVELQQVLDELSDLYLLTGQDTDQTLSNGGTTLDAPSLYKDVITIVLNDGSYDLRPLIALPGGYREYLQLIANSSAGDYSTPRWFAEYQSKFYVYPISGGDYTTKIDFYKDHIQTVEGQDDIEFGDEFRNCIYWGVTFYVALKRGLSRYFDLWGSKYANEHEKRRLLQKRQPSIVRG